LTIAISHQEFVASLVRRIRVEVSELRYLSRGSELRVMLGCRLLRDAERLTSQNRSQ